MNSHCGQLCVLFQSELTAERGGRERSGEARKVKLKAPSSCLPSSHFGWLRAQPASQRLVSKGGDGVGKESGSFSFPSSCSIQTQIWPINLTLELDFNRAFGLGWEWKPG